VTCGHCDRSCPLEGDDVVIAQRRHRRLGDEKVADAEREVAGSLTVDGQRRAQGVDPPSTADERATLGTGWGLAVVRRVGRQVLRVPPSVHVAADDVEARKGHGPTLPLGCCFRLP
jgi:hypothetical protein